MRLRRWFKDREVGQVLPIMTLLVVAFIGLLGLAIDGGRLFVAKAELSRALDSAALAGVVEMPNDGQAQSRASAYMAEHLPEASINFPPADEDFQFRVEGSRTVDMVFMDIFGFGEVDVDAVAAAGFGGVPVDAVLAIDSTGSMGSPCNRSQSNSGCPIKEAKDASADFADILLSGGTGDALVGVVPYRGCYDPPRDVSNCIPRSWIIPLSSNNAAVQNQIDDINSTGGSGTNVCLGLHESGNVLFGAGSQAASNTLRFIVLLSDGDNTYNSISYGDGAPPSVCRPDTSPQNSDGNVGASCSSAQTRERELDEKTYEVASDIQANGGEIFVVGFGVCGSASSDTCNTGLIGGGSHDNTADRNLLKCVASSAGGTNDHYYEVPTAEDLPGVFQQIAQQIAFRLVE